MAQIALLKLMNLYLERKNIIAVTV